MMESFSLLAYGFAVAATPQNLFFCFVGALCGTLIGVLPGLGPVATISLLLPLTYGLDPVSAIIMISGIFYGAQYGGSTTAILMNIPGESTSVVTALDGYRMAQQGKAGEALAIAAIGSFIAGLVGSLAIAIFAPPLAKAATKFESPDYFSLMVLGLIAALVLASGSILRAVAMVLLGLLLGLVGSDVNSGMSRMTFDYLPLMDGINFVALAMGLFGVSEIVSNLEQKSGNKAEVQKINSIWPSLTTVLSARWAIMRGTLLGIAFGILPGGGATMASFSAYALEKKISNRPAQFGRGAIEGVAAPESANNAAAQTSFIPLLTLGLPTSPTMALIIGALILHGVAPGPMVVTKQPDLFWGLIASMFFGNIMLVIINMPLIGLWVRLLNVPYRMLFLIILVISSIGVYSVNNSAFDILLTVGVGFLGYLLRKLGAEPAPLLMGFVLGGPMEENLRRSLIISRGDYMVFLERPISCGFLLVAMVLLASVALPFIKKRRATVFEERAG
jgi:putative tricarboxylic transport membrane protein